MSRRGLAILAAVTLVSVVLALWGLVRRGPALPERSDAPVLAGLSDRINDVATIEVTTAGQTTTVQRGAAGWTIAERHGYPADETKLRELLLRLAELRQVEAKTADPARLPRLELDDPAAAESKAKQVRLLDTNGQLIAGIVVGKEAYGQFGPGRSGGYVRRLGEDQAWLADAAVQVPGRTIDWIRREILDIPAAKISSVVFEPPGGAPLTITAGTETGWAMTPLPEGREIDPSRVERSAGILGALVMQDVRPAAEVDFTASTGQARFETTDGRTITLTWVPDGKESWVRFSAQARADAGDEARQAVQDLGPRIDGWAYKLSEFITARLRADPEDLLLPAEAG